MSLRKLLLDHFRAYPVMQAADMLKLIYQNEFGPGHFAADKDASLEKLKDEMMSADNMRENGNLYEDIGDSLCRLNLAAVKNMCLEAETINMFFMNTADRPRGSVKGFEKKLDIFLRCCDSGDLPFSAEEIRKSIKEYKEKGYPPIGHSTAYREQYMPSYRVVERDYCAYIAVFEKIDCLMRAKNTVSLAIDGRCGSGKSRLASLINSIYDCNMFHMDDFFPGSRDRAKKRLDETGRNIDQERFKAEVINGIESGRTFYYRKYDCKTNLYSPKIEVRPKRLNVVEGSYSMHPALEKYYDLKIFLYIRKSEQEKRIMKRNGQPMFDRFINEWIPMEEKYFRETKIMDRSDLVFKF